MNILYNLKCVKTTYKENKVFFLFVMFAILLLFGIFIFGAKNAGAQTMENWNETFEDYTAGNPLNNYSKWSSSHNTFVVSDTYFFAGTKGGYRTGVADYQDAYFKPDFNIETGLFEYNLRIEPLSWSAGESFNYLIFEATDATEIYLVLKSQAGVSDKYNLWITGARFNCDTEEYIGYGETQISPDSAFNKNQWFQSLFIFDFDNKWIEFHYKDNEGTLSEKTCWWYNGIRTAKTLKWLRFRNYNLSISFDNFLTGEETEYPITITSPESGATLVSAFTMEIDYTDLSAYERLMIIFEDWDASSTCPVYGDENWALEYAAYFNYQSNPYFSDVFTTSTGTTYIDVDDLSARTYKCVRCYAINETTGTTTEAICPGYDISVSVYIPPSGQPSWSFGVQSWTSYYASNTENWATSTALFNNAVDLVEPIIAWVGNLSVSFQDMFNPASSTAYGELHGGAISQARGYLGTIDAFFGGLPVSKIFLFYIIAILVVIVLKMLLHLRHLIW